MKVVAFFMAVLLLALSCIPCKDEPSTVNAGDVKALICNEHNGQDEEHTDACSPFCACSCCAAAFSFQNAVMAISNVPEPTREFSSLYTGNVIEISLPVWQPPQLTA